MKHSQIPASDLALIAGCSARLTRVVVSDHVGAWFILDPVDRALERNGADPGGWAARAALGLQCPFCVGTWLGFATLASYLIARRSRATLALWRFVAGGLSLNYLVGHVSSRID